MTLTYQQLVKFSLAKDQEDLLLRNQDGRLMGYLEKFQQIQIADRFIRDCPSYPGSTHKIIRKEMISAIGSTLAIEGGNLEAEQIERAFDKAERQEQLERCEQEAENSRRVYEFIQGLVRELGQDFIYRESMIKQIHKLFTGGLNYIGNKPGEYRAFGTSFGYPRRPGLCRTLSEVEHAMAKFVDWLNQKPQGFFSGNVITKAIMAHYYLTEIHPFADGNGRTARALEALILLENRMNEYCFWSLANFWSVNRDQYIAHLGNIRQTCDPWDFLIWGIEGYRNEITRIKDKVLKKLKQLMLQDYVKFLLSTKKQQQIKINQRILNIIRLLARAEPVPLDKFLTSPEIATMYSNVSLSTRRLDFQKMDKLGIVEIYTVNDQLMIRAKFEKLDSLEYEI